MLNQRRWRGDVYEKYGESRTNNQYSKKYYPQNWLQKQGVYAESVTFFCLNKGSLQNFITKIGQC